MARVELSLVAPEGLLAVPEGPVVPCAVLVLSGSSGRIEVDRVRLLAAHGTPRWRPRECRRHAGARWHVATVARILSRSGGTLKRGRPRGRRPSPRSAPLKLTVQQLHNHLHQDHRLWPESHQDPPSAVSEPLTREDSKA